MSTQKKMAIRMALYLLLVGYLLLDLFVFDGPVKRRLAGPDPESPEVIAAAKAKGVVARVYGQPVYRTQVEERVRRYLLEHGRAGEKVGAGERKLIRQVVLRDLIDERLVKVQIKVSPKEDYAVPEAEVDAAVASFKKRFDDEAALAQAMVRQGWEGEKELRYRVAARLQQEKFFEKEIGKQVQVGDEKVRAWYEEHKTRLRLPERRELRQIFVASLDHAEAEGTELIAEARRRVVDAGEDFSKVAGALSEDLRSKKKGGSLGWVALARLPADFAEPVFDFPLHEPTVLRTKLGWHLVEVTAKAAAREQTFAEVEAQIRTVLEQRLKEEKIEGFRQLLRHWAGDKVEVFNDVLNADPVEKGAGE